VGDGASVNPRVGGSIPPLGAPAYNASVVLHIAKTYSSLETSYWDKGAFWDDEAPAYDLSQPRL
jgi:hypothetical protein